MPILTWIINGATIDEAIENLPREIKIGDQNRDPYYDLLKGKVFVKDDAARVVINNYLKQKKLSLPDQARIDCYAYIRFKCLDYLNGNRVITKASANN